MSRARQDHALEVWVGSGRQLAGWLTTHRNISLNIENLLINCARADDQGELIEECRGFKLTPVHRVIAAVDIVKNGDAWLNEQVPLYARAHKPLNSDHIEYRWRVLRLTQEEFDWIFDMPGFEPVDTKPDRDWMASPEAMVERITEQMTQELHDTLLGGSGTAYAVGGSFSMANAQPTSANESVMTVEKLDKMLEQIKHSMFRR